LEDGLLTPELKELLAQELHRFEQFLLHLKFLIRDAPEVAQQQFFAHLLEEETEHFEGLKALCTAAGVDVAAALKPPRPIADIVAEIPGSARPTWNQTSAPADELATVSPPSPGAAVSSAAPPSAPGEGGPRWEHRRARDLRRFTVGSLIQRR
jgi:hypothetical protein